MLSVLLRPLGLYASQCRWLQQQPPPNAAPPVQPSLSQAILSESPGLSLPSSSTELTTSDDEQSTINGSISKEQWWREQVLADGERRLSRPQRLSNKSMPPRLGSP